MILLLHVYCCLFFSRKLRVLVTGGCGYFAFQLAKSLYALGTHVRLLDVQLPPNIKKYLDDRFTFVKVVYEVETTWTWYSFIKKIPNSDWQFPT